MTIVREQSSSACKKVLLIMSAVMLLTLYMIGVVAGETRAKKATWKLHQDNPVIKVGQKLPGMIWNDPSVIREGKTYRMWLSGGVGHGINHVSIYLATSADGLKWTIGPTPVLKRGRKGEWDDEKAETPTVIKVKETYHMYYSGFKTGDIPGKYQIGHAASPDGVNWRKDPGNPVISYTNDPSHWGYYHAAEPGAVYDPKNRTICLYYMTSKARIGYDGSNPNLVTMHGICLAVSSGDDGSKFLHYDSNSDGLRDAVLVQSPHYSPEKGYRGYSTPSVCIDSKGLFNLYYDVIIHPKNGEWQQVALAHATSTDGKRFVEVASDIIVRGSEKWTGNEIRAPSVMQDGSIIKMWYAGQTDWFRSSGIGYATAKIRLAGSKKRQISRHITSDPP